MVDQQNQTKRAANVIVNAIKQGDVAPIEQIVQHGFDVDTPIKDCDVNMLMEAATNLDAESFKRILAMNPNVNARDKVGRTALHFACRAAKMDTFNLLVENEEVDLDAVTNAGVTPLMMAIESGEIDFVAECLNNNMNPFVKDALERTASDYAKHYRDVMGHDMRTLIENAQKQWMTQTEEAERTGN